MSDRDLSEIRHDGMVACHECDAVHRLEPLEPGSKALCTRCGSLLFREPSGGIDRPLALAASALGLFLLANLMPFIALKIEGRVEENLVISGVFALWRYGMPELSILVFLTSVLFPLLIIVGLLWLLVPLRFGVPAPGAGVVVRVMQGLSPWALLSVFMLGFLVAFVKLMDMATVVPGISMFAFAGLVLAITAAVASFDISLLWPRMGPPVPNGSAEATASELGMVSCHTCTLLQTQPPAGEHKQCPRCSAPVHANRKTNSIARTWALVVSAGILIIPANVYPVMTVIRFGQGDPSTILGGVVQLIAEGMWGLAMIIFFASIVVPVMKLTLLVYLLVSVQRKSNWRKRDRTRLYRITEVVGAWSMVDIFLVGILSALVNLQALATIEPGIGATYFGAVVIITMFAAQSFDPRLIWDNAGTRT